MRTYTKRLLELVEQRVIDKDTLIRDLLNYMDESDVKGFCETPDMAEHFEDPDDFDDQGPAEDDEDWRREVAMEAGMLHGTDGYNEAMGYDVGPPEDE